MTTIAEIQAAIGKLRPEEFAELAEWMAARQPDLSSQPPGKSDFDRAVDKVFAHHAPLLNKLAQ